MATVTKGIRQIEIDLDEDEDIVIEFFVALRGSTWLETFFNEWLKTRIAVYNEEKDKIAMNQFKLLTVQQKKDIKNQFGIEI